MAKQCLTPHIRLHNRRPLGPRLHHPHQRPSRSPLLRKGQNTLGLPSQHLQALPPIQLGPHQHQLRSVQSHQLQTPGFPRPSGIQPHAPPIEECVGPRSTGARAHTQGEWRLQRYALETCRAYFSYRIRRLSRSTRELADAAEPHAWQDPRLGKGDSPRIREWMGI